MVLVDNSIFKENYRNKANGLDLLDDIKDSSVDTAFFDPQYRGVLDKLSYGNEGVSRGQDRCGLTQMGEEIIKDFILKMNRVIKPSGHLFLWVDKFHLCEGTQSWFEGTDFNLVDLIVWDKGKIGMGYRTRRKSEYLIVYQKSPVRAKGCWNIHTIPDVWEEKVKKVHPHSKPENLQSLLIEATVPEGGYVLDPASGGYSVYRCCLKTKRNFIGGDIEFGEEEFVFGS